MTIKQDGHSVSIETPSGKDADYENFPVGSFLLPRRARPHVAVFYRYARAIDDIADNPSLSADDKIARLDGFASAILGATGASEAFSTGSRMRESLLASNVTEEHCLKLIDAFKQDAIKSRYADWQELIEYCDRSAAPVGRYLIDLTGGAGDDYRSSDALCNALQVINHLQDCKDDYETMDRVYLPGDWMQDAGATFEMLSRDKTEPELRRVMDRCLDATAQLMLEARPLPSQVKSRRLAMEAAAIIEIADRLIDKLRREDPLRDRVELSKVSYFSSILMGAARGLAA